VQSPLTEAFDSIIKDNDPQNKKGCADLSSSAQPNNAMFQTFGQGYERFSEFALALSVDQLREALLLPEGFFTYDTEHQVTVVCEKISPITEEKRLSVFTKSGVPVCQVKQTTRQPGVRHCEVRRYMGHRKEWSQWSNF